MRIIVNKYKYIEGVSIVENLIEKKYNCYYRKI